MFARSRKNNAEAAAATQDLQSKLAAISRSQAVIEFNLDGTILEANENFLSALGYSSGEIVGRHHSLFMDPAEAATEGYRAFWQQLRAASSSRRNSGGSPRAGGRSGSRPPTIRSSMRPESPTRS
jgi:methyl-accepting chemotaxis protein